MDNIQKHKWHCNKFTINYCGEFAILTYIFSKS